MRSLPIPPMERMEPHLTSKAGPNGPHALLQVHKDALTITETGLVDQIRSYCDLVHPKDAGWFKPDIDKMKTLGEATGPHGFIKDSRLHFLSEGGGKTRVIAIGDFWSQQVLKGLHDKVMKLLKRLSTDGTYSHNRVSEIVKSHTALGKETFCFDLSSATDRFPVSIQEQVVARLIGAEAASH